jgi:glycosidase
VTAIYLNPIFAAPSNHRYDTTDYLTIDPDLGSPADFAALVAGLKARGMRLILDGVFNHVSSDSPWFDRARRFSEVGACESPASTFRSWFTFRAPSGTEPSPCAPSQSGGTDTYYVGWAGFDTIPELQETPPVLDLINGPQGVVRHWLGLGTSGWRLDVMDNLSVSFMEGLRAAAKAADPDALILGEQWGDSSAWLLGNQADSVMNYRFRRAAIGLINGSTADLDGEIEGLSPTQFQAQMLAVREDYPAPAYDALLNVVDSHDTTRILWTLTPGADNAAAKSDPTALAEGKAKLREVATLQLTWPGMASIYYGDEVGLSGQDDPDDRRPFPWDSEDANLRAFYATLARLRADHEALRIGDLRFVLADDAAGTLGFVRRTDHEAILTVMNTSSTDRDLTVDVGDVIPDGLTLADALGGGGARVAAGKVAIHLAARTGAVLVTAPGADLAGPAMPTGLVADARSGAVALRWVPVQGARSYRVYRSLVAGGGDRPIGETSSPAFTDTSARNGTPYHYRIVALDESGNPSPLSDEATGLPQLAVTQARLEVGATQGPISATSPPHLSAVVEAPGSGTAGPTVGLRLQLGFGPNGSDPTSDAWTWSDMHYDSDAGGADRYVGEIRPETAGLLTVAGRLSTSGGQTWVLFDRDGLRNDFAADRAIAFTALAPSDVQPPPAPSQPELGDVSGTAVTIRWSPVDAPDVYRYQVWRSETSGGPYVLLGTTSALSFVDVGVQAGGNYAYVVTSQDTSYNTSAYSPELAVTAAKREVAVTFTVTVPDDTPPGDTIYIAGDFQGWNPGATAMTRVDETHWSITLSFEDGLNPQYKYTRGTWDAVEKDAGCGEIPNRTIEVTYGDQGAQPVGDIVQKWRDIDHCG